MTIPPGRQCVAEATERGRAADSASRARGRRRGRGSCDRGEIGAPAADDQSFRASLATASRTASRRSHRRRRFDNRRVRAAARGGLGPSRDRARARLAGVAGDRRAEASSTTKGEGKSLMIASWLKRFSPRSASVFSGSSVRPSLGLRGTDIALHFSFGIFSTHGDAACAFDDDVLSHRQGESRQGRDGRRRAHWRSLPPHRCRCASRSFRLAPARWSRRWSRRFSARASTRGAAADRARDDRLRRDRLQSCRDEESRSPPSPNPRASSTK